MTAKYIPEQIQEQKSGEEILGEYIGMPIGGADGDALLYSAKRRLENSGYKVKYMTACGDPFLIHLDDDGITHSLNDID